MGFFSFLHKRRNQMRETAQQLGMEFHPKDEYGLIGMMKEFQLFKSGHGKKISNIFSHKRDVEQPDIRVFDYTFAIDKVVIKQTVFYIHSKALNLPDLLIKPENFFHQIRKYFGMQDINFEAFPAFSDQYLVQGSEEALVRKALNEEVLHHFTFEKDWSLEGLNYMMIFYNRGKRIPPEQIADFYQHGLQIFNYLKKNEE